jgi:hypothetical protein
MKSPDNPLLKYLQIELLTGLKETIEYCETLKLTPKEKHGLSIRLKAMYFDCDDALDNFFRQSFD